MIASVFRNIPSATAFWHGPVQGELTKDELEFHGPGFELVVGVKTMKRWVR